MAVRWGLKVVEVVTDSATVYGWVSSVIRDTRRLKVSGLGEMLVRRRLAMLAELIEAYSLSLVVNQVPSAHNLADELTRVPKRWLTGAHTTKAAPVVAAGLPQPAQDSGGDAVRATREAVEVVHRRHHLGARRTLFLARKELGRPISRKLVRQVVRDCQQCQRIDPAPAHWRTGTLEVAETWERLAADITHYKGRAYLTLVDCGPSRFAIWRRLTGETAREVAGQLRFVLLERGAPAELITDNGPCFRGAVFSNVMHAWGVRQLFSCAYRPSGNGIIERSHRTIKRMAARADGDIGDMVFWYNMSPNQAGVVPMDTVMGYEVHVPCAARSTDGLDRGVEACPYQAGDHVYVRPHGARCTTPWLSKVVSAVLSDTNVEIDGVPRHVRKSNAER